MASHRKSKKVSWAPDFSLCQFRQFSSEDSPSKAGLGAGNNLQFKRPRMGQSGFASNNLPSGILKTIMKKSEKLISIPSIKWKCPPEVELNPDWLVASGEQSEEVGFQKQRELKVFEAVYPHLADIPDSPSGALCKDRYLPDGHITPTIRTTPIEDDETITDSSSVASPTPVPVVSTCPPSEFTTNSECANSVQTMHTGGIQEMISSSKADVGAAASAALTALLKSNEIGSSIDTDILIDIFNNPETVSMLLNRTSSASIKPTQELASVLRNRTLSAGTKSNQQQVLPTVNFSCSSTDVFPSASASGNWGGSQIPRDCSLPMLRPKHVTDTMVSASTISSLPTSVRGTVMSTSPTLSFRNGSQPDITHEVPSQPNFTEIKPYISSATVTPKLGLPTQVKDANYYKNLIKRHGIDKQNSQGKVPHTQQRPHESAYPDYGLTKQGPTLAKNPKPCVFHNTPRGCRKGLECPFLHITSSHRQAASDMTELPNAKRMKLGRSELTSMTMTDLNLTELKNGYHQNPNWLKNIINH